MLQGTIKKITVMFGASLMGIVLGFLVSIFNSRVLGPEDFGNFKFIETVARFIASIVSVGIFISLTRILAINRDKATERKYVGLFTYVFGITSLIGILLFIIFSFIEPYFFESDLGSQFRIYFFIVASIIGYTALLEILKGMHKINTIALVNMLPILGYLVVAYLLNLYTPITLDHTIILTYGILLLVILVVLVRLRPDFKIKKIQIAKLLHENKFNGRPIYYGSLAGVATTHIAGLSISYFMDNTQVGFFMLAMTICTPLLVIPSVIGTIFFKQFVNMKAIPKKVYAFSIASTAFALIVFYSLIEYVVVTFYTEDYLPVSDISKYIIIGFIFHGFGDLLNRFLGAKGKGKWLRNAAFLVGIVNVVGYTILIKYFNINGAILTKILASGLYLVLMIHYYLTYKKKQYVQG